jgi:membrane protease YdiL (CAAX protease family)
MPPSDTTEQPSPPAAADRTGPLDRKPHQRDPHQVRALPFPDRPLGALLIAVLCSLVIAASTHVLAPSLLPPMPKISDAADASEAAVGTILIPGIIRSLIASLLFLSAALVLAWQAGLRLRATHTGQGYLNGNGKTVLLQRSTVRIGLGDRPLGAIGLLVLLTCGVIAYGFLLSYLQLRNLNDFFGAVFRAGTGWRLAAFLVFGLLAPFAEEMMFRGWLWTALRRSWPGFHCTLATGLIWVLTHFGEGPAKLAILAPVALALGIARQFGASWRGSLLLHLALNLTSLTAPFILRWANIA